MMLWVQRQTMKCARLSALMKDAGVRLMTNVFPVGISDSADSVLVSVKHWLVCIPAAQENAGTAIQNASITALET